MKTLMTRQAIVFAFMRTALYTKQVAGSTWRLADLDASPEIYHCAAERSAQLFNAGAFGLKTLYIRLQPQIDVGNT